MKTTMNLDDALVREAMAIHPGKTKTAVVELGLQELINGRASPQAGGRIRLAARSAASRTAALGG